MVTMSLIRLKFIFWWLEIVDLIFFHSFYVTLVMKFNTWSGGEVAMAHQAWDDNGGDIWHMLPYRRKKLNLCVCVCVRACVGARIRMCMRACVCNEIINLNNIFNIFLVITLWKRVKYTHIGRQAIREDINTVL